MTVDELMALADAYADAMERGPFSRSYKGNVQHARFALYDALRAAIEAALTPGEPVGEVSAGTFVHWVNDVVPRAGTKLYLAPQPQREWVSLDDASIDDIAWPHQNTKDGFQWLAFARAIEAKLREKNGGGEYPQDTHQPRVDTHQPPCKTGSQCTSKCQRCSVLDWEEEAGKQAMRAEEYKAEVERDTALLKQALELLTDNRDDVARGESLRYMREFYDPAIAALRERLK